MLKYIGVALLAAGLAALLGVFIAARRSGVRSAIEELSLIKKSGYVVTHKEMRKGARLQEEKSKTIIKAAPKKRAISKEAMEILERVEREKRAEREAREANHAEKSRKTPEGTDILHRNDPGTDILERKSSGISKAKKDTDILDKRTAEKTDILTRKRSASADSTDILENAPKRGGGTDLLPERNKREENRSDGTDLLARREPARKEPGKAHEEKGSLRQGGTDILRKSYGTDILQRYPERDRDILSGVTDDDATGILQRSTGSPGKMTDTGTEILERSWKK